MRPVKIRYLRKNMHGRDKKMRIGINVSISIYFCAHACAKDAF